MMKSRTLMDTKRSIDVLLISQSVDKSWQNTVKETAAQPRTCAVCLVLYHTASLSCWPRQSLTSSSPLACQATELSQHPVRGAFGLYPTQKQQQQLQRAAEIQRHSPQASGRQISDPKPTRSPEAAQACGDTVAIDGIGHILLIQRGDSQRKSSQKDCCMQ